MGDIPRGKSEEPTPALRFMLAFQHPIHLGKKKKKLTTLVSYSLANVKGETRPNFKHFQI